MLRGINLSAAIIILVCFFLPWEQVSCGGATDTLTGLDLARDDHASIWFIPVFVGAVVLLALFRVWRVRPTIYSVASAASGLITAYLMNRERLRVHDDSGLIAVQLTGWFWLGFLSSLAMSISALALLLKKQRGP